MFIGRNGPSRALRELEPKRGEWVLPSSSDSIKRDVSANLAFCAAFGGQDSGSHFVQKVGAVVDSLELPHILAATPRAIATGLENLREVK